MKNYCWRCDAFTPWDGKFSGRDERGCLRCRNKGALSRAFIIIFLCVLFFIAAVFRVAGFK